jgi:hypothetical protein
LLLADLVEFATRHRACGQLTGDATEPVALHRAPADLVLRQEDLHRAREVR